MHIIIQQSNQIKIYMRYDFIPTKMAKICKVGKHQMFKMWIKWDYHMISLEGMMLKLKLQYFGHLMRRVDSLEKTLMLGGIGGKRRRGTTENEMAGWHHWLDGRESQWTPGIGDGQGGLACCDSWGCKESDTTERLNWTELNLRQIWKNLKDKEMVMNHSYLPIDVFSCVWKVHFA